jgi:hypothetical protein
VQHVKPVKVLLFEREGFWTAQCLEYDIGAEGKDKESALQNLKRSIRNRMALDDQHGRELLQGVGEAPYKYHAMYDNGTIFPTVATDDSGLEGLLVIREIRVVVAYSTSATAHALSR